MSEHDDKVSIPARLELLSTVVTRMVKEDPVNLAIQSTRALPAPVRKGIGTIARKLPDSTAKELASTLADVPVEIDGTNAVSEELKRITGVEPSITARPLTRARYEWNMGNVDRALSIAPIRSHLHAQLADEWRLLTWDGPKLPKREPYVPEMDALHVLINSAPHTNSGYTVRTRAILEGQKAAGLDVAGVTRISYPVSIGKPFAKEADVVGGVTYHRLLPEKMPKLPVESATLHAQMLADLVSELRPRLLHATTNYANAIVTKAAAEAYGIPWVYEMRGQLEKSWVARHPEAVQAQVEASQRFIAMKNKETAMAKAADAVVVLSEVQKLDLIERGVDEAKIKVIPNAYSPDPDAPKLSRAEAKASLGLEQKFTVGTVTAVVDYEGLDTLVRAVKLLSDDGVDLRCVIVGDGVSLPGLRELVAELGIEDRVVMPGRVPREQSHTWYQAIDLFAVPRKDTAVCRAITPIKPIEAMSTGAPIVASDLPPLRELVIDPGSGLACEPGNEADLARVINRIISDGALYDALSVAARANALDHTWEANISRYLSLYSEVTS